MKIKKQIIAGLLALLASGCQTSPMAQTAWNLQRKMAGDSPQKNLCQLFLSENGQALTDQIKYTPDTNFCENLTESQLRFTTSPRPGFSINKINLNLNLANLDISCEVDQIINDSSVFSHVPTANPGMPFYFPAGGKGCAVTGMVSGTMKTWQLIKKFTKYDGKPLKDIIGADQNLTSYYPNNVDVKVPYPNGGSLFSPFAFTGAATVIYASAEKEVISRLLYLAGMAPVTFKEHNRELAIVMLIIYNFHDSGVGPYTEFQVAPIVQPDIKGQILPAFASVENFVNGLDSSPGKGLSKSYGGRLSVWQNHLIISSYSSAFAELAIKGGRGVSYPKFLGQQQQAVNGNRLMTWVSQPKTAVSDEFQFQITAIFPKAVESLPFVDRMDQSLTHSNLGTTTNKWCNVIVQANSKDSTVFAKDFEPAGTLQFAGESAIAKRLSAMRLKPVLAQISKDLRGATWTTKRDCGPVFYGESSFMDPVPVAK